MFDVSKMVTMSVKTFNSLVIKKLPIRDDIYKMSTTKPFLKISGLNIEQFKVKKIKIGITKFKPPSFRT